MSLRGRDDYPELGEFIIGTVKSIFKQGAFIELDEYPGRRGMLHISEITLKWVRNIRDYVREGQKVVLLVLRTDPERGHIDLSLRRVNEAQRKEKLQEVKQRQRAVKLLELLAKEVGEPYKVVLEKTEEAVLGEYDSLYAGLEAVSGDPANVKKFDLPKKWIPKLVELCQKNIKQPFVEVTGYVSLKSFESDGVGLIRESLKAIRDFDPQSKISVSYVSPPVYRIKVKSEEYKKAEKTLRDCTQAGISFIEKSKGVGEFYRELPKPS